MNETNFALAGSLVDTAYVDQARQVHCSPSIIACARLVHLTRTGAD
jgi:hypothetical protein